VQPVYAAALTDAPRLSFCPVGQDTVIVSPDGRLAGCYLPETHWQARGMDLRLGCLGTDGTARLDPTSVSRLRRLVADKPRCRTCFCQWTCAGACHVHQSYPGSPEVYDDFCVQTRIITACVLLEKLDQSRLADDLLASGSAMADLARHPSDRLEDGGMPDA